MDLIDLYESIPPWDWPKDADKVFQDVLEDSSADPSDRVKAAHLAGDLVVFNDTLAKVLMTIVARDDEAEKLRAMAAISFGAAFEHAYLYEFDDPDDLVLSEELFKEIKVSFYKLYCDDNVPKEVKRHILEAEVRAPRDWHSEKSEKRGQI